MNAPVKYARLVGLSCALLIALPIFAEDQHDAPPNKLYPAAKPVTVKTVGSSRTNESPQNQASEANVTTAQRKGDVPDPAITPYMTYEGAASSNTDR